ncbi:MAG: alanine racemase [Gemmatimonadales bacterium]|nr:alanine racemase [Gemmatimonadales bacterium]
MSTNPTSNRGWLAVDLPSLLANARAVREAARGARLLPVVKADAYGLGAVPVARALERLDPWGFAVATIDEGAALRLAGIARPILVLTPAMSRQRAEYARHGLRAVLGDPAVAAEWAAPFHLEIDTGMGRCGVRWDDPDVLHRFHLPTLEGVFTHFFAADEDAASVGMQWGRFREALAHLGTRPPLLHAANSAAAWRLDEKLDLVRPGIFLYGGEPVPDLPAALPVATVRAPVVSVRRLRAGDTVSYGAEWAASRDTTIATLGIGYADGVPRLVEGRAHVLLRGVRLPVVGRVTMDFVMVDAGPAAEAARVGDVATIIGRDGDGEITLHEFAEWSGTISYEVLTRLGARLRREYVGG